MSGSWGNTANGKVGGSSSQGGWGHTGNAPQAGTPSAPAPAPHHNAGGFWGTIQNAVHKLVVKPVQHDIKDLNKSGYVGQQLVKAGTLVGQIPTGLVDLGVTAANPVVQDIKHGPSSRQAKQARGQLNALPENYLKQNIQTLENPGRNLLATGLTVLPIVSGGASIVARVGAAGRAAGELSQAAEPLQGVLEEKGLTSLPKKGNPGVLAKSGVFGKTLLKKPEMPLRTLSVPKLEGPGAGLEGPANLAHEQVYLPHSKSALSRTVQAAEDKFLQHGINQSFENGVTTRAGKLALKRVAGSNSEVGRYTGNLRNVPANLLERANKSPEGLTPAEASLTHFLRSANVTPEEWANYSRTQASELAAAGGKAAKKGAASHAELAAVADSLAQKGVLKMVDGAVQVDRGKFPETAAQADLQAETQSTREATLRSQGLMDEEALQSRKDLVLRQMEIEDRQGQGFTSLKSTRPVASPGVVARSVGKVLPQPKFSLGGKATGKSVQMGMIPADTLKGSAYSLRQTNKLQNTSDLRGQLYHLGSDVRTSKDDWLVAAPAGKMPALPADVKILMGKLESTLTVEEHKTLSQKLDNYVHDNLLRQHPDEEIGQSAPEGYRFVNKNLVPNLLKESPGRGETFGKYADVVNSAVTSATVYTKLGHLPQRFLTNATTNFIQGGLNPVSLARSLAVAKKLTDREKLEIEALTGAHASNAPLIGATSSGHIIAGGRKLAGVWARKVDAPFRLNSLLYELRQIGYDTPEGVRQALKTLKDPARSNLPGHKIMQLDGAVRRSNRAAIMYDGLNNIEKNSVSRYVWFYPWTKGALRFAGHTAAEHPIKSGIMGQLGQEGTSTTRRELGAFPTYEAELTKLGGSEDFPLVANLSALTPYGTLSNTAMLASHPTGAEGVGGLLNPALSGLVSLAGGEGLKGLAKGTLSPTPEFQIGSAFKSPKADLGTGFANILPTSSKNLFGQTWQSMLARAAIGGTAMPRKINKAKLNDYAAREHEKKRTITIYSK